MTSEFAWTIPALAAAAAPVGVIVAMLARRGLGRGRAGLAWGAAVARGAAVTAGLLGAAGPTATSRDPVHGVVLVAASESAEIPGEPDRVLRFPSEAPDAASALETLRAARPSDRPADLVLAWSPRDEAPHAAATIEALRPRGSPVSVLHPAAVGARESDATAPRIVVPATATEGVAFTSTLDSGERPFGASAAVYAVDGHEQALVLPAGARRVESPPSEVRAGPHIVTLRTTGRPPAAAVIRVGAPPSVLLVTQAGVEPPFARRLRAQGLAVTVASDNTADFAPKADVIVLGPGTGVRSALDVASRVAAGAGLLVSGGDGRAGLSRFRGTALEDILPVRLPESPTPPDPAPVPPPAEPPPPSPEAPKPVLDEADRKAFRVALLLCIDRSGSMAGIKLTMAREAAIAAARTLTPEDRVGVVAFEEVTDWIAPFQAASDMASLYRRIQGLRAGGGTNFFPALKSGIAEITAQDCGIRHIILITDGATRTAVFREMVEGAAEKGVTLSTVAVGDGADTQLLGFLAQWGRGRLYPAVDPERLPQVLTLDTKRFVEAPRDRARERPAAPDVVPPKPEPGDDPPAASGERPPETTEPPPRSVPPRTPRVAGTSPFLAGLEDEPWPPLRHAEDVGVRGPASAPLAWDDGNPAMVLGRAGAGRCAVIAADVVSADAREFWAWPDSGRVLAQLARFLAPPQPPADGAPNVRFLTTDGPGVTVVVDVAGGGTLRLRRAMRAEAAGRSGSSGASGDAAATPGGVDEIRVMCVPEGDVSVGALPFRPSADVWIGDFTGGPESTAQTVACTGPRPVRRDDTALAEMLAERSGARLVDALPAPRDGVPVERHEDHSAPFLVTAAALLVAEAALRRGVKG